MKANNDMKRQPGAMTFQEGCRLFSQTGWNRGSLCTRPRTLCPETSAYFNLKGMLHSMEKIVNLAKQRGFVFPGSEIYGGLANTWDYGPLGIELKNNIKKAWWQKFVQESPHNVGLDAAILMNPKVWEASGHTGNFNDPMIDCKKCKTRHRVDKLIEDALDAKGMEIVVDGLII